MECHKCLFLAHFLLLLKCHFWAFALVLVRHLQRSRHCTIRSGEGAFDLPVDLQSDLNMVMKRNKTTSWIQMAQITLVCKLSGLLLRVKGGLRGFSLGRLLLEVFWAHPTGRKPRVDTEHAGEIRCDLARERPGTLLEELETVAGERERAALLNLLWQKIGGWMVGNVKAFY